jgi:hypothetical protein
MRRLNFVAIIGTLTVAWLGNGCYIFRPSNGADQTKFAGTRKIDRDSIAVVSGHRIGAVTTGLIFPTGVTFDDQGRACVVESGYSYGEVWTTRMRVRPEGGEVQLVAWGFRNPFGLAFLGDQLYVTDNGYDERGAAGVGRSRFFVES